MEAKKSKPKRMMHMKKHVAGAVLILSATLVGIYADPFVGPQPDVDPALLEDMTADIQGVKIFTVPTRPIQAPPPVVPIDLVKNVGNGMMYAYKITQVDDKEVRGYPLNYESRGNRGIYLYPEEVGFDVKVGDEIGVVWGEEEDEFKSIEPAIMAEDGTYVGASFYE